MKSISTLLMAATFTLSVFATACTENAGTTANQSTDADKEWGMPNKNYASTRYSSLNSITTENVKDLKVAWSFSTGVLRGHEGGPLVIGSTMYVHTPFPDIVYALDL